MKNLFLSLLTLTCLAFSCNSKPKNNNSAVEIENQQEERIEQPCLNIFDGAWSGNLSCVKTFIEQGVNIDTIDVRNGASLLSAAASSNNTELIKYIVEKGANVKFANESGETALHYSAWKGNIDAVKILVKNGAEINVVYNANGGLTPLCCAAESGSMEIVIYLIDNGAEVNYTNKDSRSSPLRSAAYHGHFDIFKYIISKSPKNSYDWQEVLFYGLIGGNLDIIKYTVEKRGANVNKPSKIWKELPIRKAADNKYKYSSKIGDDVEILKYLVSKGAKLKDITNENIIAWAMEHSNDETIKFLLQQGFKYEVETNKHGWDPLPRALDESSFIIAKHLLETTSEDPHFRNQPLVVYFADGLNTSPGIIDFLIQNGINNKHYSQAFLSSAKHNDIESIKLLLNAQADINIKSEEGLNALAYTTNEDVAKYLIEKGIDTKNEKVLETIWMNFPVLKAMEETGNKVPVSKDNATRELWNAARIGNLWCVNYFISKGAELNQTEMYEHDYHQEKYKLTPLMVNAYQGYEYCDYDASLIADEVAKVLIKAGANIHLKDDRGKTALHIACGEQQCLIGLWPIPMGSRQQRERGAHGDPAFPPKQPHDLIVKTLLNAGAKINNTDNDGNTPLILAVQNENTDIVKLLIDAKADINVKNKKGKNTLFYASETKNNDIKNMLTEAGAIK